MGWGSAYEIFNAAADALIAANASDEIKETTLTKLIAKLQGDDWDTELDSLQSSTSTALTRAVPAGTAPNVTERSRNRSRPQPPVSPRIRHDTRRRPTPDTTHREGTVGVHAARTRRDTPGRAPPPRHLGTARRPRAPRGSAVDGNVPADVEETVNGVPLPGLDDNPAAGVPVVRCRMCHRPLTTPEARLYRLGPECAHKLGGDPVVRRPARFEIEQDQLPGA